VPPHILSENHTMNKGLRRFPALFIFLFVLMAPWVMVANTADTTASKDAPDTIDTKFRAQLSYGSDNIQQGHRPSVIIPYSGAMFEYTATHGFHTALEVDYFWNDHTVNETWFCLGYRFVSTKKFDADISWTKYFYNASSAQSMAGTASNLNLDLDYDFKIIYSELSLNANFFNQEVRKSTTRNADFTLIWYNSHDFAFEDVFTGDDLLEISPGMDITLGSQYYYTAYYNRLKARRDKKNLPTPPSTFDASFRLTSLEFNLPVDYSIGNFRFEISESYYIPENQPKVLRTGNSWFFSAFAEVYF
jgi:hypothetical protein